MKAATLLNLANSRLPVLASHKYDSIRCLTVIESHGIAAVTASLKQVPNDHIRESIEAHCPPCLDGEIICRGMGLSFRKDAPQIMTHSGTPEFAYMIFDYFEKPELAAAARYELIKHLKLPKWCVPIYQHRIDTRRELKQFYHQALHEGWEGIMLKWPNAPYKFGRSTVNEFSLVKLKPFVDGEAIITGFKPQYENQNQQITNKLGHAARSKHKANLVSKPMVGAILAISSEGDKIVVGGGISDDLRREMWKFKKLFIGRQFTYKKQLKASGYDKPRSPQFLRFRDENT